MNTIKYLIDYFNLQIVVTTMSAIILMEKIPNPKSVDDTKSTDVQ